MVKVNDAVYYATWGEYFDNLLLHNLIFPGTAYRLLGFVDNDGLCAVLEQPYIIGNHASLDSIYEILDYNGFINTRRQDYFHEEFGFFLEDMHDQNVLDSEGALFFIDTVFYII